MKSAGPIDGSASLNESAHLGFVVLRSGRLLLVVWISDRLTNWDSVSLSVLISQDCRVVALRTWWVLNLHFFSSRNDCRLSVILQDLVLDIVNWSGRSAVCIRFHSLSLTEWKRYFISVLRGGKVALGAWAYVLLSCQLKSWAKACIRSMLKYCAVLRLVVQWPGSLPLLTVPRLVQPWRDESALDSSTGFDKWVMKAVVCRTRSVLLNH